MLLIIILILSQDKGFCQNIQEVTLPSVAWYKERLLQKTSLGIYLSLVHLHPFPSVLPACQSIDMLQQGIASDRQQT